MEDSGTWWNIVEPDDEPPLNHSENQSNPGGLYTLIKPDMMYHDDHQG